MTGREQFSIDAVTL